MRSDGTLFYPFIFLNFFLSNCLSGNLLPKRKHAFAAVLGTLHVVFSGGSPLLLRKISRFASRFMKRNFFSKYDEDLLLDFDET